MMTTHDGRVRPAGDLSLVVERNLGDLRAAPKSWHIKNWLANRRRELPRRFAAGFAGRIAGIATLESHLCALRYTHPRLSDIGMKRKLRELLDANVDVRELAAHFGGQVVDFGLVSTRLVTDAGVAFLVDALQNLTEPENFKFHGYGTGTTAEAASQTALVTELTTQYATDNVRPTGSQTENAANIYRTVGTLSPDTGGTIAVTEHGIFSATSAGTLLDRSVFSAINVVAAADSLQTTYDFTITSGG